MYLYKQQKHTVGFCIKQSTWWCALLIVLYRYGDYLKRFIIRFQRFLKNASTLAKKPAFIVSTCEAVASLPFSSVTVFPSASTTFAVTVTSPESTHLTVQESVSSLWYWAVLWLRQTADVLCRKQQIWFISEWCNYLYTNSIIRRRVKNLRAYFDLRFGRRFCIYGFVGEI